jgi:hypothetical protein
MSEMRPSGKVWNCAGLVPESDSAGKFQRGGGAPQEGNHKCPPVGPTLLPEPRQTGRQTIGRKIAYLQELQQAAEMAEM